MGRHFNPLADRDDDDAPSTGVKCDRCGTDGLSWYNAGIKHVLWDDEADKPHKCPLNGHTDDFPNG